MGYVVDLSEHDDLDLAVDAAIEAAGGDARAAILDLVRRHHALENAIACTVSAGYIRRQPAA